MLENFRVVQYYQLCSKNTSVQEYRQKEALGVYVLSHNTTNQTIMAA